MATIRGNSEATPRTSPISALPSNYVTRGSQVAAGLIESLAQAQAAGQLGRRAPGASGVDKIDYLPVSRKGIRHAACGRCHRVGCAPQAVTRRCGVRGSSRGDGGSHGRGTRAAAAGRADACDSAGRRSPEGRAQVPVGDDAGEVGTGDRCSPRNWLGGRVRETA